MDLVVEQPRGVASAEPLGEFQHEEEADLDEGERGEADTPPAGATATQQPARERHQERDDERRGEQGEPAVARLREDLRLRMGVGEEDLVGDDVAAEEAGDRPADRDDQRRSGAGPSPGEGVRGQEPVEQLRDRPGVRARHGDGRAVGERQRPPRGIGRRACRDGLREGVLESLDVLGRDTIRSKCCP